jgi:hypothetical protein
MYSCASGSLYKDDPDWEVSINLFFFVMLRILQKLQTLVILNESLKQQEVQFREQCKLELGKLQKLVK